MKLREAFLRHHRRSEHSPRTVETYLGAIGRWEQLAGDPDVAAVTNETLSAFREAAAQLVGPSTVNKWLTHVGAILSTIGPAEHGNPYGLGLITAIPRCRPMAVPETEPRAAERAEIVAVLDACHGATWPRLPCCDPGDWWRALVLFECNVGARREDFRYLRWSSISLSRGHVMLAQRKTKKLKAKPLHEATIAALRLVWSPRGLVFPTTAKRLDAPPANKPKQLYEHWYAIQRAAGVEVPYTFQQLRSTCATWLLELNPAAAQAMLGHASLATTQKHYANVTGPLRSAVGALDLPTSPTRPDGPSGPGEEPHILRFPAAG